MAMESRSGIHLIQLKSSSQKMKDKHLDVNNQPKKEHDEIYDLIEKYDKNHDGVLDEDELEGVAKEILSRDHDMKILGIKSFVIIFVLLICIGLNYVLVSLTIDIYKSASLDSGRFMVNYKSKNNIALTSKASVNVPLAYLPLLGLDILNNIEHIGFTALDIQIYNNSILSGNHSTLKFGMSVNGYYYLNETSTMFLGHKNEKLLIDFGYVTAWDLNGMREGDVVSVCPGIIDTSHGKCSIVNVNEVDVSLLDERAAALGMLSSSSYPSRRMLSIDKTSRQHQQQEDTKSSSSSSSSSTDSSHTEDRTVVVDPLITIITPSKSPYRAPVSAPQLSSCYPPIVGRR